MVSFGQSSGGGRRSAAREEVPLPVILSTIGTSWCVALVDLSCTGARLRGAHLPPADEYLQVKIESIHVFGTVRWASGDVCGVEFDEPITSHQLGSLRQCGTAAAFTGLTVEETFALDAWLVGNGR